MRAAAAAPDKGARRDDRWKERLEAEVAALGDAQYRLYADGRYAVLLIFQALDAAGKDSTIRHMFSGVNPCGLHVMSSQQPSRSELAHDFLWRRTRHLPERGSVAIFNRSYYEEVLVVRVHPELLAAQRLPDPGLPTLWEDGLRAIVDHERHLAEQGTVILKFWLNVSRSELRKRLIERIDEPRKNWKFSAGDLDERARWDDCLAAYAHCLNATSHPRAPRYAIPADDKHYLRWQVARLVNDAFDQRGVDFPRGDSATKAALAEARRRLAAEAD